MPTASSCPILSQSHRVPPPFCLAQYSITSPGNAVNATTALRMTNLMYVNKTDYRINEYGQPESSTISMYEVPTGDDYIGKFSQSGTSTWVPGDNRYVLDLWSSCAPASWALERLVCTTSTAKSNTTPTCS